MHADAVDNRVPGDLVETKMLDEIQKAKQLTAGASAAGARVHTLPSRPSDIEDDGEFHFAPRVIEFALLADEVSLGFLGLCELCIALLEDLGEVGEFL